MNIFSSVSNWIFLCFKCKMCFILKSFCCFVSLEVGAQLISVISTLMSTLITVLYISAAVFLQLSTAKRSFYAVMAVAGGLQCVCAGLLSYGAFNRRPTLMWPWLVTAFVTGLGLLLLCVGGSAVLLLGNQLNADVNIVILAYFCYALFLIYCSLVVNSRRLELIKERDYVETAQALMRNHQSWRYY